ncbi:hypothetical protein V8G54_009657 [Vigna mungo]|uniref:Ion transport domain-containing protein n=1 Tax=Vigna mungo TaxID=3915 RepID=A0AAQ3NWK5_VIGMU
MKYLSSYFTIDILSIIPLPQMVILAMIISPTCSAPYVGKDLLKYTVIAQYVPRLLRIYPLFKEVTSTSGILTETAWAGAAYNLFLYMLASHNQGSVGQGLETSTYVGEIIFAISIAVFGLVLFASLIGNMQVL